MINKAIVQGRLTRDPELRRTASDVPVASFTVAWSEKYKETETQLFLDCTAWRHTGEFVNNFFRKGQEVVVEGKLHTDKWQDKDGNNRTSIKMTVEQAHFCGPKQDGQSASTPAPSTFDSPSDGDFTPIMVSDDDLPF